MWLLREEITMTRSISVLKKTSGPPYSPSLIRQFQHQHDEDDEYDDDMDDDDDDDDDNEDDEDAGTVSP